MKTYNTILLLATSAASAAVLEAKNACNQDNCFNAVRATQRQAFATTDCLNFLAIVTATPTSYITLPAPTVTSTVYSLYSSPPVKRSPAVESLELDARDPEPAALVPRMTSSPVSIGTIPAYASACSGGVRYSSACSCLGVTANPTAKSTITEFTTTVTATVTPVAVTQTSTISACNPSGAYPYGLAWGSGSWAPPTSNHAGSSSFSATAAECCAQCFTMKNCAFFEYFAGICYLTTFSGGPTTNPYNTLCPNGLASFQFTPGSAYTPPANVFGEGPCAVPQVIGS